MYIQVRFTGHNRSKPFWVDKDVLYDTYNDVRKFIQRNVDSEIAVHHNIYRRITSSRIFTYQKRFYMLDGWCNKKLPKKDPRRWYGRNKYRCFNCKGSEWAKKGIYIVPGIKTLKREHELKDSSGINPIDKDELRKRILENIFGTLFDNSINYAKSEQNMRINLHAELDDEPMMYIPAKHFLRIIDMYEKYALDHDAMLRRISRVITNSVYGIFPKLVTPAYGFNDDCVPNTFKAHYRIHLINPSGEVIEEYNIDIPTDSADTLCDLLKRCLEMSNADKENLTIDITFIAPKK